MAPGHSFHTVARYSRPAPVVAAAVVAAVAVVAAAEIVLIVASACHKIRK
jgi:hypothetical protein